MNERDYTGLKLPDPTLPASAAPVEGKRDAKATHAPRNLASAVRLRFALLNAFVDRALPRVGKARLHRSEIAAWQFLYRYAKPDGKVTASVADIAHRTGCSERQVHTALKRLVSGGLLERLKRGTLAGGPSVWRLLTPSAPDDRQCTTG